MTITGGSYGDGTAMGFYWIDYTSGKLTLYTTCDSTQCDVSNLTMDGATLQYGSSLSINSINEVGIKLSEPISSAQSLTV